MLFLKICACNSRKISHASLITTFSIRSSPYLQKKTFCAPNPFLQSSRQFSVNSLFLDFSQSFAVLKFQEYLAYAHDYSGLPWWLTIMLTTFGIRSCIVFPLTVHQNQVLARLENLNKELLEMAPELNKEVNIAAKMYKLDKETARKIFKKSMRDYYHKFVIRDNCHPFKSMILIIFQIPFWMCLSMSLRNLTYINYMSPINKESIISQLSTEGVLWFSNLTMPDKIVLPLLLCVVNLTLIEIYALRNIGKGSLLQKVMLNLMRCVTLLISALATINPTAVTFYWLCSSTFGFCQNLLLMKPSVRRKLNIPKTSSESSTPFENIVNNLKKKFKR